MLPTSRRAQDGAALLDENQPTALCKYFLHEIVTRAGVSSNS